MEIKRNVNDTEMTFKLTDEELRKAAAENIHKMMMSQAPISLTRAILNQKHESAEAMEETYDATLEELLQPENINKFIVIPAIQQLDPDTSLNEAMNGVIDCYLTNLPVIKAMRQHIETFEDSLVASDKNGVELLEHDRAERIVFFAGIIDGVVRAEAEEAGEKDFNAFCEKTYGHTLTELLDAESPFYLPMFAAELAIIIDSTKIGECEPMAIVRIALNTLKDDILNEDDGVRQLHSQIATLLHFFCFAGHVIEATPDDICDELYGCSLVDAFDPDNENYILIPVEDEDDECECDGDCECECLYSCEDDMPIFEFLMSTILGHAREDADDELMGLLMQLAASLDPAFNDSEWPCCDECGLPLFPCDDWECEDEDDDMEVCNLKGQDCPICGQPIEHDCEVMCCRCHDCDCKCEDDDENDDNGICPICGHPLDRFPSEEEDPDQLKMYEN